MLEIQLLGSAEVLRDGAAVAQVRGQKAWGLLAYLLLSEVRNPARQHLAELLFADADDPLRSLRWNLSELRRALGQDVLGVRSAALALGPSDRVDVDILIRGTPQEALALPGLGHELLEGMSFDASPAFGEWLAHERRRLMGAACSALHEAALDRLADRRPQDALPLARRLVELESYDENFHELLIRTYAQAGDGASASRQLKACRELFRRELGCEPAESLTRAAKEESAGAEPPSTGLSVRHAAGALIEAGEAAAAAGAVDTGLASLRRAAHLANDAGARGIEAQALLTLGSTLVHGVRGRDEEGAALLRRAASLAEEEGMPAVQGAATRELGVVDGLAGRYSRSVSHLARAVTLAQSDGELAAVETVRAVVAADVGAHSDALRRAARAIELAAAADDPKGGAYAFIASGRSRFLTGDLKGARADGERSIELAKESEWLAFAAWPETLVAEVDLARGDLGAARERFEYAFALACEFRDPCWEGFAGRGLGLIEERNGDVAGALRRLEDARQRAGRTPDAWIWGEAYTLEALAQVAVRAESRKAPALVEDLRSLAGRTGMREMAVKALAMRHELGDPDALDAARLIAAEVENPVLEASLA